MSTNASWIIKVFCSPGPRTAGVDISLEYSYAHPDEYQFRFKVAPNGLSYQCKTLCLKGLAGGFTSNCIWLSRLSKPFTNCKVYTADSLAIYKEECFLVKTGSEMTSNCDDNVTKVSVPVPGKIEHQIVSLQPVSYTHLTLPTKA